jgi:serine/threonine protein kinase/tetratricopeptide (TPR) repeat protein
MGVVYKAEDTKLNRTVALKFLPPEMASDREARTRFVREAQAASALQHNNICTIHEIDETPDGRVFICMDFYDGETLQMRTKRGSLPVDEAVSIVRDVATGLARAHAAGIVHRDIKPANLVMTADGVVKVVDFGLAKLAGVTRVTKVGTTMGTVAYMSPEHALGEEIDHRSDVFSLGIVLYELLTGELPFRGDQPAAVMHGIAHNEPPPLAQYREGLPAGLQHIIDRALAKDGEDRYQSMVEFAEDLVDFTAPRRRAAKRWRSRMGRRRRLVTGGLGLIAAVAIGLLWWTNPLDPGAVPPSAIAVVDFSDVSASDDSLRVAGMSGLIHVGLVENSPCRVVSPSYLMDLRRRLFGTMQGRIDVSQALEIARESGATMLLTGQIGDLGETSYLTWELVDTESGESVAARRAEGDQSIHLADAVISELLPVLSARCGDESTEPTRSVTEMTTTNPAAYQAFVASRIAEDQALYGEMFEHLRSAVELDSTFALAHFRLAKLSAQFRRHAAARESSEMAWKWRANLSIKDRMQLDAWRAGIQNSVPESIELYRELHERWPDDLRILEELINILYMWRYANEGLEMVEAALDLYPVEPSILSWKQTLLKQLGLTQEAVQTARQLARLSPDNANNWDELGLRFVDAGSLDSARVAFEKALEVNSDFRPSRYSLADLAYYRGDLQAAIEEFEGLLSEGFRTQGYLINLYAEAGRYEQASRLYDEVRRRPADPVERLASESRYQRFLLRLGRSQEVLRWTDQALEDLPAASEQSGGGPLAEMVYKDIKICRVHALAALDSLDVARAAAAELMEMTSRFGNVVRLHALLASAKVAVAEGNLVAAHASLDQLEYEGVGTGSGVVFDYPDLRAEAYRISGRFEEALAMHEGVLAIRGGHAMSHYRLGVIYQEMERLEDAEWEFTRFLEMWSTADEGLPELLDARQRLTEIAQAQGASDKG